MTFIENVTHCYLYSHYHSLYINIWRAKIYEYLKFKWLALKGWGIKSNNS